MMDIIIVAILAFLFDCIFGDPQSKLHPVVLIGKLIALLERFFLRKEQTNSTKFMAGFMLMMLVLIVSYDITLAILHFADLTKNTWAILFVQAFLLSCTISPRSLAEAGVEIRNCLVHNDLQNARYKVSKIVGRDTDELDGENITRATIETIAENIVDGIISPLFFYFIGGVPLAVFYRAANTMDSMIGYKNDTYLYFGCAAARLDDVLNFIPARITGGLLVIVAFLLRFDYRNALLMMRRDASKHPSPNGGYTEATVAGALHIRLGGLNYYFGKPSFRAYMGESLETLTPLHIKQVIILMYGTTVVFLLLSCMILFLGGMDS
jgi:adenosylcobinamide-phosphate synthase